VSASLLTAAGRACSNQIVDVLLWLRSAAFTNARHEADKEHEGCPTAAPGPSGGRPLFFKNVRVRGRHRDVEESASAPVAWRQVLGSPWAYAMYEMNSRRLPSGSRK
jgi:hypothetical protein